MACRDIKKAEIAKLKIEKSTEAEEERGSLVVEQIELSNLQSEHNIDNVTTYSLHPGVISTGIARHFSDNFLRCTTWLFDNLLSWFLKSPRCGAQTTIHCAVDPACATDSGLYYRLSIDWSVRSVTK
ncbi:hypothetical protein MSG28_013105 [Choristoneura fumiferana]|uniref:Uncharacterized protein n=1 Tax=Choristoneura fumiferana TaxID=7141 RepID=A0ACC0KSK0_CHOFU|nr:hypothetical protein MSG28_013105 [Choristoneura fumiferana]